MPIWAWLVQNGLSLKFNGWNAPGPDLPGTSSCRLLRGVYGLECKYYDKCYILSDIQLWAALLWGGDLVKWLQPLHDHKTMYHATATLQQCATQVLFNHSTWMVLWDTSHTDPTIESTEIVSNMMSQYWCLHAVTTGMQNLLRPVPIVIKKFHFIEGILTEEFPDTPMKISCILSKNPHPKSTLHHITPVPYYSEYTIK
jgi:hypothetical protein